MPIAVSGRARARVLSACYISVSKKRRAHAFWPWQASGCCCRPHAILTPVHVLRESPTVRGHSDETPEHSREVRLCLKADTQCDVHKALLGVLKKHLGTFDASPQ